VRIQRIVVAPGNATVTRVSSGGSVRIPIRRAGRFDDLAAELSRRLGVPAEVRETGPVMPSTGTLVVCRPDVLYDLVDTRPATLPWVVGVDLLRRDALDQAETHGLAAAVSLVEYQSWVDGEDRQPAIYGRRDAAAKMDAAVDSMEIGPRYARITSPAATSLPALLATYLSTVDPLPPLT
jgi:hypothetical protein